MTFSREVSRCQQQNIASPERGGWGGVIDPLQMRDVPTSSEMTTADCVILVQKGNKSRYRLVKI